MSLQSFARQYRLKIRLDECGDPVIPGRRGQSQLYFDGDQLCLMVIDGRRVLRPRWEALGGKLWIGEKSRSGSGWIQDVKVTSIPLENAPLAIKLARVMKKRNISEEQRQVLVALSEKGVEARRTRLDVPASASPGARNDSQAPGGG